ncbi:hypothetical protein MTDSW087_01241 [Methylobacterium dankookense]|uniref:Uncharacterized protein n=1 Tax=Methylobacterium dankookense TaxID=560405 RepID=A0A564FTS8_9HYPH|nr:hypothetical protein IFDJLNFL_4730 [Methylobacterium dankookense]VUF11559.1 hypothetical protein MTDSW087_01241 [Methylobacterium dankookense]
MRRCHVLAQDRWESLEPQPNGARTLTRDLLQRSLIAALLYLSIATAVMAVACAFDWMEPQEDQVADGGEDDPAGAMTSAASSAASWAQAR